MNTMVLVAGFISAIATIGHFTTGKKTILKTLFGM